MMRRHAQRWLVAGLMVAALTATSTGTLVGCRNPGTNPTTEQSGEPTSTSTPSADSTAGTAPAVPTTTAGSKLTTSPAKPYAKNLPKTQAQRGANVAAYRGLGAWVDIYDPRAWNNPEAAVADMARHGVKTLYLETGNFKAKTGIFNPPATNRFIDAAHRQRMYVVAWYLPALKNLTQDYGRIVQAIRYRTPSGGKFDSVAVDIEATVVKSISARNAGLATLSRRLRSAAGQDYPLGGIIPSPVGLAKAGRFWNAFPYATVARYYDVIVPMAYYTYHGNGGGKARTDALGNMTILRTQPGCSSIPVHLVGGLTGDSSDAEVLQFTRAARQSGCIGVSLYDWVGTTAGHWRSLSTGWPTKNP